MRVATRYLLLGLKLLLSAALLYFVVHRLTVSVILEHVRQARPAWLLLVLVIFVFNSFLLARRWSCLSLGLLSRMQALKYTWIGFFFGSLVPGGVSGDIAKGLSLAMKDGSTRHALLPASIVLDKLVGLALLLFFFVVSVFLLMGQPIGLTGDMKAALRILALCAAVGLLIFSLFVYLLLTGRWRLRLPRVRSLRLGALFETLDAVPRLYKGHTSDFFTAGLLSVFIHVGNAAGYWFILKSISFAMPASFAIMLYSLLSVVTMLPISISGIGARDVAAAAFFAGFGLSREAGVAFSWILLGISVPMVAIGGMVQAFEAMRRQRTPLDADFVLMPVIHIVDNLAVGGCQTSLRMLASFPEIGRRHYFIALRHQKNQLAMPAHNTTVCRASSRYSPLPLFEVLRLVRRTGPAILHCHLFKSQVFGLLVRCIRPSCRLVFHERGRIAGREYEPFWEPPLYRAFLYWAGGMVDLFIANSHSTLDYLERFKIRGRLPSVVIYNCVFQRVDESTQEQHAAARDALGLPREAFIVGFAGRIVERKGWREFLEAAEYFRNRAEVLWLIAGYGPEEAPMRKIVRERRLPAVRLIGIQTDMDHFYQSLDACLVPSHWEPHGLVQIEAQSYGLPVVASDVPGMAETVHNGRDAILVPPGDASALIAQVERLLAEADLRLALSRGALVNARRFTIKHTHDALEGCYASL